MSAAYDGLPPREAAQLYKAWGETRFTQGSLPTDYQYTGQQHVASIGLYYYGARWYDPALGRFVQADIIVPNPFNTQDFDRFHYVLGNPVRFNDPSGYCTGDPNDPNNPDAECWEWIRLIEGTYSNITIDPENWTSDELEALWDALVDHVFLPQISKASSITIHRTENGNQLGTVGGETKVNLDGTFDIYIYDDAYNILPTGNGRSSSPSMDNFRGVIAHELAHIAVFIDPSLIESYRHHSRWRLSGLGGKINWTLAENSIAEHIALAAGAWEVDPTLLIYSLFFNLIELTWEYNWMLFYACPGDCLVPR